MTSFCLGTYNIRKGKGASGRAHGDVDGLASALAAFRPDVMLCQEVFHGPTRALQQSHVLAHTLHLDAYYVPNRTRNLGHSGNASFSRFAATQVQNYDISTNRIERRGALYTRLELSGQPLHIFNVHLGLNQGQRLRQVRQLAQIVLANCKAREAVVIAGDFNDWTGRVGREMTEGLGFTNAFAHLHGKDARTFHARRPVFNLDRVYVKHLEVEGGVRYSGEPWSNLSDHLPLRAQLRLLDV